MRHDCLKVDAAEVCQRIVDVLTFPTTHCFLELWAVSSKDEKNQIQCKLMGTWMECNVSGAVGNWHGLIVMTD